MGGVCSFLPCQLYVCTHTSTLLQGVPGGLAALDLWEQRESHYPMLHSPLSPRRVILVYQGRLGL